MANPSDKLWTVPYVTTVAATALAFVSIGVTIPILPFFVTEALRSSESAVGLVFAATAISAVLCRPILGRVGDMRGRRVLLISGSSLCAIGLVGHLIATNMPSLMIARLVLGAGQAGVMIAATTLALDLAPRSRRGESSSYLFIAVQVGLGTGPVIGELFWRLGINAAWLAATVASVLSASLAMTLPQLGRGSSTGRKPEAAHTKVDYGITLRTGLLAGLGTLGFAGYLAFLPLYASGIGVGSTAGIFLLASGTIAAVRLSAAKVPDRLGPRRVARASLIILAIGFVVIAACQTLPGLLIGTVAMATGMSLLVPSLVLSATANVSEGEESRRMSLFTLFLDLGAALGPSMIGIIATNTSHSAAFAVCAGAAALALVLLLRWVPGLPQSI